MPARQARGPLPVDAPYGRDASLRRPAAAAATRPSLADVSERAVHPLAEALFPSDSLYGGLRARCGACDWEGEGSDPYVLREDLAEHILVDHPISPSRRARRGAAAPRAVDGGRGRL